MVKKDTRSANNENGGNESADLVTNKANLVQSEQNTDTNQQKEKSKPAAKESSAKKGRQKLQREREEDKIDNDVSDDDISEDGQIIDKSGTMSDDSNRSGSSSEFSSEDSSDSGSGSDKTSEPESPRKSKKRSNKRGRKTLEDLEDMLLNLKDDRFLDRVVEKKRKLTKKNKSEDTHKKDKGKKGNEINVNNSHNISGGNVVLNQSPSMETLFEKLPAQVEPPRENNVVEGNINDSSGPDFDSDESMELMKEFCDRLTLQKSSFAGKKSTRDDEIEQPQPSTSSGRKNWNQPYQQKR